MAAAKKHRIEVVRGRLSPGRSEQVLALWAENKALTETAARERLPQVVCLLIDDADQVAGVNSVYAGSVALIGNRRLWIYRAFLVPGVPAELNRAMAEAAHRALAEEFGEGPEEPIGICVFADAEAVERDPETVWPGTGMLHAGYLRDGRQVRVGYFEGARV